MMFGFSNEAFSNTSTNPRKLSKSGKNTTRGGGGDSQKRTSGAGPTPNFIP